MQLSWNDITVDFSNIDSMSLLHSWQWLIGEDKQVILITRLGEAFLQDTHGNIFWLDIGRGQLILVADSYDTFQHHLQRAENIEEWFSPELVMDLRQNNVFLETDQVYSFRTLPVLGGTFSHTNFIPKEVTSHFQVTGQLHERIRNQSSDTMVIIDN